MNKDSQGESRAELSVVIYNIEMYIESQNICVPIMETIVKTFHITDKF